MSVVGRVGRFITQGMYSVATPFHPFGGAVDIIVVKRQDGTFRSTPWYVRFGKFQGVLKGSEKVVRIEVNGVEANFNMHLDNSGEAYFVREVDPDKDDSEGFKDSDDHDVRSEDFRNDFANTDNDLEENNDEGRGENSTFGKGQLDRVESDSERMFYEFQDEQSSLEGSMEYSEYGSSRYDNLDSVERALESQTSSEVVLVSVDGHILTAPITSSERNAENVEFSTPQFHLGPGEATEVYNRDEASWSTGYSREFDGSEHVNSDKKIGKENLEDLSSGNPLEHLEGDERDVKRAQEAQVLSYREKEVSIEADSIDISGSLAKSEVFQSCLEFSELSEQSANEDQKTVGSSVNIIETVDDADENCPPRPLIDNKTEQGKEILKNDDELSVTESGKSGSSSLTELKIQVSSHERDYSSTEQSEPNDMPIQVDSNNQEPQEQVDFDSTVEKIQNGNNSSASEDEFSKSEHIEPHTGPGDSIEDTKSDSLPRLEMSLCGNFLQPGMGLTAAENAFNANEVSLEEFKHSAASIVKNENLIIRIQGKYVPWNKASHLILGMAAFGLNLPVDTWDAIPVEHEKPETKHDDSPMTPTQSRRWRLWPMPFRRTKPLEHSISTSSTDDVFVDSDSASLSQPEVKTPTANVSTPSPRKQIIKTHVPTTDQIASLNLKEGQNMVNFIFNTRVLGVQKVEAHIYLWRWNTKIVISDVDGTITKSDVLGQFMPLVGKDWTHSGIARLFSAIKENGYQLLFLSARAIVQAYLTKSFLVNLKQDGKSLPNGPVVISPDGLFPSLYREVIRRAPHEFKIACLEDIKALFPPDHNPFYAGFGNRDTDELSYRKIGIPKGKIFIINPKGEVAISHRIDVKSYTSLHTLVHDMFPPTSLVEQEDYNSWNYWKMPLPDIDGL